MEVALKQITLLFVLALLSIGCASSFGIQVVPGLPEEMYLTYSRGANVQVGEVYALFHVERASSGMSGGGHAGHGGGSTGQTSRHEMGRVQVVKITDETHALVKVLSGVVQEGLVVERAD